MCSTTQKLEFQILCGICHEGEMRQCIKIRISVLNSRGDHRNVLFSRRRRSDKAMTIIGFSLHASRANHRLVLSILDSKGLMSVFAFVFHLCSYSCLCLCHVKAHFCPNRFVSFLPTFVSRSGMGMHVGKQGFKIKWKSLGTSKSTNMVSFFWFPSQNVGKQSANTGRITARATRAPNVVRVRYFNVLISREDSKGMSRWHKMHSEEANSDFSFVVYVMFRILLSFSHWFLKRKHSMQTTKNRQLQWLKKGGRGGEKH